MLYRSISVAIILLLSWFAYTSTQSSQRLGLQLSVLQQRLNESAVNAENSVSAQEKTAQQIATINTFIASQNKLGAEKKQLAGKLAKQVKLSQLQATYSAVLKSELLRLNKQNKDAAKLLKSTKKNIWKAGDTYKDKQKALRGLMPKIDTLINAWNKGDSKASAKSVYSVLGTIIQEKGK